MVSSVSVTLAMALTTTTGPCCRRPLTMAATRSIARASSTEVPPNFMTIIGVASWREYGGAAPGLFSPTRAEGNLCFKQFRIQERGAPRAAGGVVGEHAEPSI